MPIIAIGTDIVSIPRLRGVYDRHRERFLQRHFTQPELEYCLTKSDPLPSLAARFAAKEAFQKCWPESFGWLDVWVELDGVKPKLCFVEAIHQRMQQEGWVAHLSLSHEREHATAFAMLEGTF